VRLKGTLRGRRFAHYSLLKIPSYLHLQPGWRKSIKLGRWIVAGLYSFIFYLYNRPMAIVLAVANQKGGCGKTTISMNIAGCLGRGNYRVLLIDADPQGSAMQWRNNQEQSQLPFEVALFPFSTLHQEVVQRFVPMKYDVILIDCPPGATTPQDRRADITRSALLCSHAVLMPVRPTPLDYQASRMLLPLLQDVSFGRGGKSLDVYLVINGKPPARTRLGMEAQEAAKQVFAAEGITVQVLKTEICTRQSFAEAPLYGKVVVDFDPDSKAATEIEELTREFMACLNTKSVAV